MSASDELTMRQLQPTRVGAVRATGVVEEEDGQRSVLPRSARVSVVRRPTRDWGPVSDAAVATVPFLLEVQ